MTSGPANPQQALSWFKEAVRESHYETTHHLMERLQQRQVTLREMLFAIQHGQRAEPFTEPARRGGTTWRIFGKDPQGRRIAIGAEAYVDQQQRWAVLCTVIDMSQKGAR